MNGHTSYLGVYGWTIAFGVDDRQLLQGIQSVHSVDDPRKVNEYGKTMVDKRLTFQTQCTSCQDEVAWHK